MNSSVKQTRQKLTLDAIRVLPGPRVLASNADVEKAEAKLGIRFPAGYREYVTRIGRGELFTIRIHLPDKIARTPHGMDDYPDFLASDWFWDSAILTQKQALEGALIGDTSGGEQLLVHPSRPGHVFVLERQNDNIVDFATPDLLSFIEAFTSNYEPQREFENDVIPERWHFQPY